MAKKTVAQLKTETDAVITSNNNREITGEILRAQQNDVLDSYDNLLANARELGDGAPSNKFIYFNEGSANMPGFRWNEATGAVQFTNDGTTWQDVGAGGGISDGDYGDVTVSGGGTVITIDNSVVTNAKLSTKAENSVVGNPSTSPGGAQDITAHSVGDVLRRDGSGLGFGQIATAGITDNAVDNTKLSDMIAQSIKSNPTGSVANPSDLLMPNNTVLLRAGANIEAKALAGNQTIARFSGDIVATQLKETEDAGNAAYISKSSDRWAWLGGTMYRNWATVAIASSATDLTIFSGSSYKAVRTGLHPQDTADHFFQAGSLKAGNSFKIKLKIVVTGTPTIKVLYGSTQIATLTLATTDEVLEFDVIPTVIDSATGAFRVLSSRNGGDVTDTTTASLNTTVDQSINVTCTTGVSDTVDVLTSEIIYMP